MHLVAACIHRYFFDNSYNHTCFDRKHVRNSIRNERCYIDTTNHRYCCMRLGPIPLDCSTYLCRLVPRAFISMSAYYSTLDTYLTTMTSRVMFSRIKVMTNVDMLGPNIVSCIIGKSNCSLIIFPDQYYSHWSWPRSFSMVWTHNTC